MITVDQKALHALAHAARIYRVMAEKPDHPRAHEYARQVKIYKLQWAILTPEQQTAVAGAANEIPDLEPEQIASTTAALEA